MQKKPKVYILENVVGLVRINGGVYFKAVLEALGTAGDYNIYHRIMDTKDHGIPHSRPRVYIVGILSSLDDGSFEFPDKIRSAPIGMFLDKAARRSSHANLPNATATTAVKNVTAALRELTAQGKNPLRKPYVIDCDSTVGRSQYMLGICPCITCRRGQGHWLTHKGRRMNKQEMLRLQGMDPSKFKAGRSAVRVRKGAAGGSDRSPELGSEAWRALVPPPLPP